ncbi:hypothetical protein LSAT2_005067 [Lamellibrachia satsuma]|nr:hypothetical protein LSAT2_005067 [Lamellibrachia satsuma]
MCAAGNFSYDGREPCRPCPIGFYQDQEGQKNCMACATNTTAQEASISTDNCTAPVCDGANVCKNGGICTEKDNLATCSCVPASVKKIRVLALPTPGSHPTTLHVILPRGNTEFDSL